MPKGRRQSQMKHNDRHMTCGKSGRKHMLLDDTLFDILISPMISHCEVLWINRIISILGCCPSQVRKGLQVLHVATLNSVYLFCLLFLPLLSSDFTRSAKAQRGLKPATPRKINMEPKNHPIEKEIIFQTIIFRFHVNLPGCKGFKFL